MNPIRTTAFGPGGRAGEAVVDRVEVMVGTGADKTPFVQYILKDSLIDCFWTFTFPTFGTELGSK